MRKVNSRIWRYYKNKSFTYPEDNLESIKKHKYAEKSIGLAISGGGTRSAACTIGYLKALKDSGLLENIKYISAVSGGAWAAIPYTYLKEDFDDDIFLGKYLPPTMLTSNEISRVHPYSFQKVISDSKGIGKYLKNILKLHGDETFARTLGEIFLKPYGLFDKDKFFTWDKETFLEAKSLNPKFSEKKFYFAKKNRPYLIAGGTILDHELNFKTKKYQVEYTPYYSGVRKYTHSNEPIGGGYINSFAYDSKNPRKKADDSNDVRVSIMDTFRKNEFSLCDMMASTGAAPQEITDKTIILRSIGFPEFRHWSVIPEEDGYYENESEFSHSDGGHLENFGIMPLLARQVKNIIVFINSKTAFNYNEENPLNSRLASSLKVLFLPSKNKFSGVHSGIFDKNIVLEGKEEKYLEIIEGFKKCLDDKIPLIYQDTYSVKKNNHYEISAYNNVKITWIYNNQVSKWENSLSNNLKTKLEKDRKEENGDFANFPHYKTFAENFPYIIDLTTEQTVMLSNLSWWVLKENIKKITSFFEI